MNKILKRIFGLIVMTMVFMGGISIFGYIIALFLGTSQAEILCNFIQKTLYPYMIQITSVGIGLGLLLMYITRKKALSIKQDKK